MATSPSDVVSALTNALSSSDIVSDGSSTFVSGQDSSLAPSQISETSYYKGINVSVKGGCLYPRAGYIQQSFTLLNDGTYEDIAGKPTTYSKIFNTGRFQGACKYRTDNGEKIVCVYSGIIFILNPSNRTAQVLTIESEDTVDLTTGTRYEPKSQRLNQYVRRYNFSQAGDKLVIFDFPDRPVIIDGNKAYRSPTGKTDTLGNPIYYVPATVMGCYNNNRLFVASSTNEFTAGDPVGSAVAPNAPVTFNELYQEAGEFTGQSFSLGSTNKNEPITAMGFLQVVDTSTGVGPMYVATKNSIYTYQTGQSRANWVSGNTAFGTMLLYNAGVIGPKAICNLNSDVIFMSGDGHIRSFTAAKSYENSWEHTPLDNEVWNWVNTPSKNLLDMTVIQYFDNRVFITVQPYRTVAVDLQGRNTADYAFKGVVVLELEPISGLKSRGATGSPAWAGIWTGVDVMDMIVCNDELFFFVKDPASVNQIYTVDSESAQDYYNGSYKNIHSRIYTKQYSLEGYFSDKKERAVLVGLQQLEGNVNLDVYRSNDYYNFTKWCHWEYTAPTCNKDFPEMLIPHSFRELNLGSPEETDCNLITNEYGELFRGTQLRLDISASNWRLEHILLIGDKQESTFESTICDLPDNVSVEIPCERSDLELYHTADFVED